MNVVKFPLLEYLLQQIILIKMPLETQQEESRIRQFYCSHSSPKSKCQVNICKAY